jgi:hypothetical protein
MERLRHKDLKEDVFKSLNKMNFLKHADKDLSKNITNITLKDEDNEILLLDCIQMYSPLFETPFTLYMAIFLGYFKCKYSDELLTYWCCLREC